MGFVALPSRGRELRRRRKTKMTIVSNAITPKATPTPIPAFAPVDRPDDDEAGLPAPLIAEAETEAEEEVRAPPMVAEELDVAWSVVL